MWPRLEIFENDYCSGFLLSSSARHIPHSGEEEMEMFGGGVAGWVDTWGDHVTFLSCACHCLVGLVIR